MNRHVITALLVALFALVLVGGTVAGPTEHQTAVDIDDAVRELQAIPRTLETQLLEMWAAPEGSPERERIGRDICKRTRGITAIPYWTPEGDLLCRLPTVARRIVL